VWCWHCRYNVSHVAIGLGDKTLAYQALKVAVSLNANHAEALNNLGFLEFQKGNADAALSAYDTAQELAPTMYEALYNGALMAHKAGELEKAYQKVTASLETFPEHAQSQELLRMITAQLTLT
jgi:tetratricopeptide repeat protein 8